MSNDIDIDYHNCKRGLAFAVEEAMGERRRAIIDGDQTARAEAAFKLADLAAKERNIDWLYQSARQQPAQQHQAAGRPVKYRDEYGVDRVGRISDDELPIAHGLTSGGHVNKEQAEQIYLHNKAKLARQRQDGSYRDDQGMVRR